MTATTHKEEYHKIQSIFKRDENNNFILNEWSTPEINLLQNIPWGFTEKVDGTNIRIKFDPQADSDLVFNGRTNNAQIPKHLLEVLKKRFTMKSVCEAANYPEKVILYGEGYGHKIQKGGKYNLGQGICDFVLFDVRIGHWWLRRQDVEDIANKLGIRAVPLVGIGTLHEGIRLIRKGLKSQWGDFEAEGIVARPAVDLFSRSGQRIITKIKGKDFKFLNK